MKSNGNRPIHVAVAGCSGRMGRQLVNAILVSHDFCLASASVRPGNEFAGRDIGELMGGQKREITVTDDPNELVAGADVVIDFSSADAASNHVDLASSRRIPIVVGATGFTSQQLEMLVHSGKSNAILFAPNTSVGVAVLSQLVEVASAALDADWDRGILDVHHRAKKDSPSGTAKLLRAALERGFAGLSAAAGAGPNTLKVQNIEVASIRAGTIVGDHTVYFAGPGERLELSHKAQDRAIYVRGALAAAMWLYRRPRGYYTMADVVS